MRNIARGPITNISMGGDYTRRILVGPNKQPLNVILDPGSSALAVDVHKYNPNLPGGDQVTKLAQTDSYGDGSSWTGAVLKSNIAVGDGATQVNVTGANVAVAYGASSDMFGATDGILWLAHAPLDDAYEMPAATWPKRYTSKQVVAEGQQTTLVP